MKKIDFKNSVNNLTYSEQMEEYSELASYSFLSDQQLNRFEQLKNRLKIKDVKNKATEQNHYYNNFISTGATPLKVVNADGSVTMVDRNTKEARVDKTKEEETTDKLKAEAMRYTNPISAAMENLQNKMYQK